MNTVERIDELASHASERPWRSVHPYGSVITDGASLNEMDEDSQRAYGGGLVCESMHPADRDFVATLVNAWPEIRAALLAGQELHGAHDRWARTANGSDAHLVAIARQELAHVAARKALAPLFEERALAVPEEARDG